MSHDNEVVIRLARIEEKMDHNLKALHEKTNDHEQRLRSNERWQWSRTGATAAMAGMLGYLLKISEKI